MSRWSAPGKLFLAGEYAVLGGGWSVVAAVDRRVFASVEPGEAYTLEGAEASPDLPNRVLSAAGSSIDVRTLSCDVTALYDEERKLGLGSSAASCAAMTALVASEESADVLFEMAAQAHRSFQRGRGSHADVAASIYGGLLAYRLESAVEPFSKLETTRLEGAREVGFARVKEVSWPSMLRARALWLGEPASSPVLIGRVEPAVRGGDREAIDALREIAGAAESLIGGLVRSDAATVLSATAHGQVAMANLGAATGAPIVTDAAASLFERGRDFGLTGKVSGAGGGDFVFFVGPLDADWDGLEEAEPGLWLDLDFEVDGVRREGPA